MSVAEKLGAVVFQQAILRETKMQRKALTAIDGLLVATLTIQATTAAARGTRKAVRATDPVAQQQRNAFGSMDRPSAARSGSEGCDRIWCYEN
jgi:hypothetical protein